jgi:hypothetical protein
LHSFLLVPVTIRAQAKVAATVVANKNAATDALKRLAMDTWDAIEAATDNVKVDVAVVGKFPIRPTGERLKLTILTKLVAAVCGSPRSRSVFCFLHVLKKWS